MVQVKGIDDLMTYRAKCNPIRGEPIVGYVTRGKGDGTFGQLQQRQNLMYDREPKDRDEWARAVTHTFPVSLLTRTAVRAC